MRGCAPPYSCPGSGARADEIRWLWSACDQIGEAFGALIELLLATGQRLNEIARLTHAELGEDDKGRPVLILSAARTKNKRAHVVPLSPLAQQIIVSARKITSKSDFVFTTNGHAPISGFSKIKRRLDAAMLAVARAEVAKGRPRPGRYQHPELAPPRSSPYGGQRTAAARRCSPCDREGPQSRQRQLRRYRRSVPAPRTYRGKARGAGGVGAAARPDDQARS